MVYLLAACLLVLTAIVGGLLWALHTGNTRLHDFMTMVMTRQDMQLRLFGDRMLSISEQAQNQIETEPRSELSRPRREERRREEPEETSEFSSVPDTLPAPNPLG